MKGIVARLLGVGFVLAAFGVNLTAGPAAKPAAAGTPLINDWSHRHVVFSQPRTPEQAARLAKDIRYQQQQARQHARPVEATQVQDAIDNSRFWWRHHHRRLRGLRMHRDWSYDLGPSATVGEARFPAKYSFSTTVANCIASGTPDFVVYATGVAGAAGQASIAALENIYSGCGGTVPGQYWGYNTGGQILSSPTLSFDGTQIAFTQTSGGTASLVLLRWTAGGTIQVPATPTPVPNGSYFGCTAPCMTTFALGANDTNSSVYYDYAADIAFVGDDSGTLHQYTGVFKGTPAEVLTGGFPISVSSSALTSPVHIDGTAVTFVGDQGGFLYRIDSTGAVTKSGQLDFGTGLTEGPIIDPTISTAYVFSSNDGTGSAAVFQVSTAFVAGQTGAEEKIGTGSSTTPVYDGAFDHDYIFSANSSGNLFVCGNPGSNPVLYAIPVSAGVMSAAVPGSDLSTTTTTKCSPVTDVYNPTITGAGLPEEWVFLSVHAAATPSACGGTACVMNFRITPWHPLTTYNTGQLILDSNMNIEVVDNSGGGTTGATAPTWPTTVYTNPVTDGTVHWRNQGPLVSNPANAGWTANTPYLGAAEIIDSNNNIEIAQPTGGTSGGTQPTWPMAYGATTGDNGIIWINFGANPVAGLGASGGTSGIIMDNTVISPGGSQIYYTNLLDFPCEFGATGGCAVQASQQGLQ